MLEVCGYLDLTQESVDAEYGAEVRSQDFDCDAAPVLYVAREVYRRHSAFTDKALDGVAIRECFCELLVWRLRALCPAGGRTESGETKGDCNAVPCRPLL